MLAKQVDSRERVFRPIPISYLTQMTNQSDRDIFATSGKHTANVKQYDEVKNLRMTGSLTLYFKGSDELEAEDEIQKILWEDNEE